MSALWGISAGPARKELWKDGLHIKVQGKVYQALVALLEIPGEIVTREVLRARMWPRDAGLNYDANVNTTVNKLRGAWATRMRSPFTLRRFRVKGTASLPKWII